MTKFDSGWTSYQRPEIRFRPPGPLLFGNWWTNMEMIGPHRISNKILSMIFRTFVPRSHLRFILIAATFSATPPPSEFLRKECETEQLRGQCQGDQGFGPSVSPRLSHCTRLFPSSALSPHRLLIHEVCKNYSLLLSTESFCSALGFLLF